MRAELRVPPDLMQEYFRFDGMGVTVETNSSGFAPPTLYMPQRARQKWDDYFGGGDPLMSHTAEKLTFELMHLRFRDQTLIYELRKP